MTNKVRLSRKSTKDLNDPYRWWLDHYGPYKSLTSDAVWGWNWVGLNANSIEFWFSTNEQKIEFMLVWG